MDVNFELYKVFYYVAKSLSFSEASAKLYISQSAVSQAVKTLEDKMGCQLFTRSTKLVKMTREGEILFKHIEQAFNLIKAGERSVQEVYSLKTGEVRIAASDTICKYHLLPCFEQFSRLYPNIKIHVTNRTSPQCIELMKNGGADLAVANLPTKTPAKNLLVTKLASIQDVFIAGRPFAGLKDQTIGLSDLARYPLLMLEKNTTTRDFIDVFLEKRGISLLPEIELESVDLLIEMAKIGLGISFVASDYIQKELAAGDVFVLKVEEAVPARSLGIITNNRVPLPASAKKFIELLAPENGTAQIPIV